MCVHHVLCQTGHNNRSRGRRNTHDPVVQWIPPLFVVAVLAIKPDGLPFLPSLGKWNMPSMTQGSRVPVHARKKTTRPAEQYSPAGGTTVQYGEGMNCEWGTRKIVLSFAFPFSTPRTIPKHKNNMPRINGSCRHDLQVGFGTQLLQAGWLSANVFPDRPIDDEAGSPCYISPSLASELTLLPSGFPMVQSSHSGRGSPMLWMVLGRSIYYQVLMMTQS